MMSGKVYQIYVRGEADAGYLLEDVSREDFMGMPCIKGTYRSNKSDSHWMAGKVTYVPFESVSLVTEYDSIEAYRDALKRFYEEKSK
jgi:hypothetical protein